MLQQGVDPEFAQSNLVSQYFVEIAAKNTHPKSLLDSEAPACYYAGLDQSSTIDADVRKLISDLIKSIHKVHQNR